MNHVLMFFYPAFWLAHKAVSLAHDGSFYLRKLFGKSGPIVVKKLALTEKPNRIAIFSAFYKFHSSNRLLLLELRDQGFKIVLVFNRSIDSEELSVYDPLADAIICRENFGYDIGAYRDGLLYLGELLNDEVDLILANDSVYYWSKSRGPVVETINRVRGFAGLTSNRSRHHVQAYFLVFRGQTGATELVAKYLTNLIIRSSKNWAIRRGEIGISRRMLSNGFQPSVYSHPLNFFEDYVPLLKECERRKLRRVFNDESLTDSEIVGQAFEKFSVHHLLGLSLGLNQGVPFKLDLTEVYHATEIHDEISAAGLNDELRELTEWYSRRIRRGVGEHGLARAFAKLNLR